MRCIVCIPTALTVPMYLEVSFLVRGDGEWQSRSDPFAILDVILPEEPNEMSLFVCQISYRDSCISRRAAISC